MNKIELMRFRKVLLICVITLGLALSASAQDISQAIAKDTVCLSRPDVEPAIAMSKAEAKAAMKTEKKRQKAELKERQKYEADSLKAERTKHSEVTFDEILDAWCEPSYSGDCDVDNFFRATNDMVISYKLINDEINFLKITTREIPDCGDGVTMEVVITDGDGNMRSREATAERWTTISLLLVNTGFSAAQVVVSGVNIVSGIANDYTKAFALLGSIKQIKTCIKALTLLSDQIPITVAKVNEQVGLMKQVKAN